MPRSNKHADARVADLATLAERARRQALNVDPLVATLLIAHARDCEHRARQLITDIRQTADDEHA